jgi:putative transport protein
MMVEVVNPAGVGQKLVELPFVRSANCRVIRVLKENRLVAVEPDTAAEPGLRVLVIGTQESLPAVADYLGRETEKSGFIDADYQQMEVVVTSPRVVGRSLAEVNPLVNHGVVVQEINRLGNTFVPRDDVVLQPMDVLQVAGPSANLKAFAHEAGHRARVLHQTDLLSLATGIALGVILGMIPIGLPGSKGFVLGMAGGPMLVALVLSHFGRVGRIIGHFPPATQQFLVRLGLALLLAGASVKAGGALVPVFSQHGAVLVAMSLTIALASLGVGLLVAYGLLGRNLLESLAAIAGGTNATPAYERLAARADSDIVLAIFTTGYAISMILMVLATQLLIVVLQNL